MSCTPMNEVVQKSHSPKVRLNPCARHVARPRRPLFAVCSRECPQMAHPRGEAPGGGPRRPRLRKAEEHLHQQFNVCMCRTRRPRCCRLMLPAPHPLAAQPSPSARPHNPEPASDPACARDHLARTHPDGPCCGRPFVPFAPSPAPARELRTRRCRPESIRVPRCAVWSPGRRGGGAGGAGAGAPAATREARRVVGGSLARPLAPLATRSCSARLPAPAGPPARCVRTPAHCAPPLTPLSPLRSPRRSL